jgi:hypothetical protein
MNYDDDVLRLTNYKQQKNEVVKIGGGGGGWKILYRGQRMNTEKEWENTKGQNE